MPPFNRGGYEARAVAPITYTSDPPSITPLDDPTQPVTAEGVRAVEWPGYNEPIYHPVSMAMYGLYMYSSYLGTDEPEYLDRASANALAILDGGVDHDGGIWFPYPFDHALHGDPGKILSAPWYSGMAQGQMLSLVSRLYDGTKDEKWKEAAQRILRTYTLSQPGPDPWFTYIDDDGYLWLEEYPSNDGGVPPVHVVNGHIYSAWGLQDYLVYVEPGDAFAAAVFDGAVTSIADAFEEYRVVDGISYYCVHAYCVDTSWQPEAYHRGVAYQLEMLALMTGRRELSMQASALIHDYARAFEETDD